MRKFYGIVLVLVVIIGALIGFNMYTNAHDTNVRFMSDIERVHEGSRSELSSYTLKIKDMAKVPAMYTKDLSSVLETYFESKNNKQSQQAVFAFMQERVPNFSPKMYEMLMVTMNAGRDSFNNIQKRKVDICANHKTFRNKFWTNKILGDFNPSDDYKKMCRVISDTSTNEAFETGVQESVEL